jgi:TRAP-type C4-dicarboxylate transport system permease large subunit
VIATASIWWLFAAMFVGGFWLVAATLAWIVERAARRRWQVRAKRTKAELIDLTGHRPRPARFGEEPAGRTNVSVRERQ